MGEREREREREGESHGERVYVWKCVCVCACAFTYSPATPRVLRISPASSAVVLRASAPPALAPLPLPSLFPETAVCCLVLMVRRGYLRTEEWKRNGGRESGGSVERESE